MNCPDNLLTGYRQGVLSSEEQARLDAHLERCPSCRLTLRVGTDFDDVLQTRPGDDLIAARFARNLGPRFVKEQRPGAAATRAWRSTLLRYAWVAVVAVAVITSAGLAAAKLGAWPFAAPPKPAPNAASEQARAPVRRAHEARVQTPTPVQPAAQPEQAPTVDSEAANGAQEVEPRERGASAAELFAQANLKRREGEPARARTLYRELQRRHPRSLEVEVSYVSLGRVLLELGSAREALEQFERYLMRRPQGPLTEEALFGKASALERLRRGPAERQTWQALLTSFPNTLYAERARHRLEMLARGAGAGVPSSLARPRARFDP